MPITFDPHWKNEAKQFPKVRGSKSSAAFYQLIDQNDLLSAMHRAVQNFDSKLGNIISSALDPFSQTKGKVTKGAHQAQAPRGGDDGTTGTDSGFTLHFTIFFGSNKNHTTMHLYLKQQTSGAFDISAISYEDETGQTKFYYPKAVVV
jgi:hypothetical protein